MHEHFVDLRLALERDKEARMIEPVLGESHLFDRVVLALIILEEIDFWIFSLRLLVDTLIVTRGQYCSTIHRLVPNLTDLTLPENRVRQDVVRAHVLTERW